MRALRFILALVAGLALLTWGAWVVVDRTARGWFDRDIQLRVKLAVAGTREALVSHWNDTDPAGVHDVLLEITRDERIMAALACGTNLEVLGRAGLCPEQISCASIGPNLRPTTSAPMVNWVPWASEIALPEGKVHTAAVPVFDGDQALGFVVLVHDMSFVERRQATTRLYMVYAFGFLAFTASIVTLVAARVSWRGWSNELRGLIRGEAPRAAFQPFVRDVGDLVDRLASDREILGSGGVWTPQRLKDALTRYLHGERIVIVANREPYIHTKAAGGFVSVVHPASGLVTALEPVMRACSGVWVAHGSGSADREVVDQHNRVRVPPGEESYILRRVWLTPEEEQGYYYGFSNEGLWPLCHIAHTRPIFRREDWKHYQTVNQKFADAVCTEVDSDDPIILVQDYHFALLPRMIRDKLPRATVLTFWHIPWPNAERFAICPWSDELLAGMLGSSILGFHTQYHCNNFLDTVDRTLESRIDRELNAVVHQRQTTMVRPYPISIEWPNRWVETAAPPAECRAAVFAELGLAPDTLLGVGVDRLDYTKGIEERIFAVEKLLERHPELVGRFTFVQLAAPSRAIIPEYKQLNDNVELAAARVNERFARDGYRPVILLRTHHEPPRVFSFYRAADLCYVSSLHDGMNLVAKEFVAARDDERGVLVLSSFTGASRELTEALIVNPYDLEEASEALAAALTMAAGEQQDRMRAMRASIAEFNVYRWAGRMVVDAARLRRRGKLKERLQGHWLGGTPAK